MRYVIMAVAALLATANWLDTPSGRQFKKELFTPHPQKYRGNNW